MAENKKIARRFAISAVLTFVLALREIAHSDVGTFAVWIGITWMLGVIAYVYYSKDKSKESNKNREKDNAQERQTLIIDKDRVKENKE